MRRSSLTLGMAAIGAVAAAVCTPVAAAPRVVATIKPVHALVAAVMAGAGEPELLVKGQGSPHTYALKPSDARALSRAELVFRMSEALEPFMAKVAASLPRQVEIVTLGDAPGLRLLERRTGLTFEPHVPGQAKTPHGHGHAHGPAPAPGAVDGHAWLDPGNAKMMVARIAQTLSAKDPQNAPTYTANADAMQAKLDALAAELERTLSPIAGKPYIVFHDAFQYFERRFDLNAVGSISISPEVPPSGKRLSELRRKIAALGALCVFAEPQFEDKYVQVLIEGTNARTGVLDPEGGTLEPGLGHYFALMRKISDSLRDCLAPPA